MFQLIGSSLLFVHDLNSAGIWMIDFGKTTPIPDHITIDHKTQWQVGNHEDGYLLGIENLIEIFSDIVSNLNSKPSNLEEKGAL